MELNNKSSVNNKIIILRKHLKSTFNQTKLNLVKKIKKIKESKNPKNSAARKESELECFKRVRVSDIPLALGVHPEDLKKKLANPKSTEIDRVYARVLLNNKVQETIKDLTDSFGLELVETFLENNEKNIKKHKNQKLQKQSKKKTKVPKKSESESGSESVSEDDLEDNQEGSESKTSNEDDPILSDDKETKNLKKDEPKKLKAVTKKKPNSSADGSKKNNLKAHSAKANKSVDSFFVSAGGENYFASVQDVNSSSSEDDEPKSKKQKAKPPKHPKGKVLEITRSVAESKMRTTKDPAAVAQQPMAQQVKPSEPSSASLHPSWIAKAQMRQSHIQEFKGTKIKFDD